MHEGMLDGGAIIGILPQQSGIGSMQSCDDARCEASQHLRRQTRGQCMWHRIMNMKKSELLGTPHFRHFHCEGQSVVGARKQSVVHDVHNALFPCPDYTLPLAVKMAEVGRSQQLALFHVHYAVPHALAACLAAQML